MHYYCDFTLFIIYFLYIVIVELSSESITKFRITRSNANYTIVNEFDTNGAATDHNSEIQYCNRCN